MIATYALSVLASETAEPETAFHASFGEWMVTVATLVLVAVTVALIKVSADVAKATAKANQIAMRDLESANKRTAKVAEVGLDDLAQVATAAITRTAPKAPTFHGPARKSRVTKLVRKI